MCGQGIRLVAVDEDGTFLRDHLHYDTKRFERLYDRMHELGIRFVVATGNQSYQVQNLFPNHREELGIVSANGAYVLDGSREVYAAQASRQAQERMIEAIHEHPHIPFSMLGVNAAYIERGSDQTFFDDMAQYCHKQEWVDSFEDVDDQIFMFSSVVDPGEVDECIELFRSIVNGSMDVVGSGDGYFDVVCPGVSKASGLTRLMERWGIDKSEVVAFGDSHNDLAMLDLAGVAYAMDNAPQDIKDAADRIAPPCTEDGVLQVLDELLY